MADSGIPGGVPPDDERVQQDQVGQRPGEVSETGYEGDLPPEAAERLSSSAWSSGLSVNDFAACRSMGLRPVALVQGFCVMGWSWYGAGSPYMYRPGYGPAMGGGTGGGFGGLGGRLPGTVGGGFGGPFSGNYQGGGGYGAAGGSGSGAGAYGRSRWGSTISSYNCPHYYAGMDHRSFGENFEQRWVSDVWSQGFNTAFARMIEEAEAAGAHGIVGVVDTVSSLIDRSIREFHVYGTAVAVEGAARPPSIWSTYLAGQRLAKLVEAGFTPVSVVASIASVRVWAVCVTQALMAGGYQTGGWSAPTGEVTQISDAQMQVRRLVRDHVKSQIGADTLHGADLAAAWRDIGEGDYELQAVLRGTRVRRVRPADPLPPPKLTVRLV